MRDYYHLNTGYAEEKHLSEALQEAEDPFNTNVYFASIPTTWSENDLEAVVRPFGAVESTAIMRRGGKSRGTGFVKFSGRQAALAAVAGLHQSVPSGVTHPITVRIADTPQQKSIRQTYRLAEGRLGKCSPVAAATAQHDNSRKVDSLPPSVPQPRPVFAPPPPAPHPRPMPAPTYLTAPHMGHLGGGYPHGMTTAAPMGHVAGFGPLGMSHSMPPSPAIPGHGGWGDMTFAPPPFTPECSTLPYSSSGTPLSHSNARSLGNAPFDRI